jgi:hypothetical protein
MSLWRKVRVLVGALAHRPLMPRPEKVDLDGGTANEKQEQERHAPQGLATQEPEVQDTERVADLIDRRQREGSG